MTLRADDSKVQKGIPYDRSLIKETITRQYELQKCEAAAKPKMSNDYNTMYVKSEGGMPLYRQMWDFLKDAPKD